MARLIPILGGLLLLGTIVQIALGYSINRPGELMLHMGIGYSGLAIVAALTYLALTRPSASRASKMVMVVLLLVVIGQVITGTLRLSDPGRLEVSHQSTAFLILALVVLEAIITSRRASRESE